jgi:DegV family protein with EDD domain
MSRKIVVDSSCGLSQEEALKRGYLYVPLAVTLGEKTYTEGVDITADQFYGLLNQGLFPKTSQPSPELYLQAFNKGLEEADEVLYVSISSKVSGAFNAATLARNECQNPSKVYLFDSLSFFAGIEIILEEISHHPDLEINELLTGLEELKKRLRVFAGMDSLNYVYKGGRLSKFHYALGIFVHAKAIGTLDEGSVVLAGKALGTKNAMKFIIDRTHNEPIDFSYPCYLIYSSSQDILTNFTENYFSPAYPDAKSLPIRQIDPLIGSHIGPLVYGVFYVAKNQDKKKTLLERLHDDLHAKLHKEKN